MFKFSRPLILTAALALLPLLPLQSAQAEHKSFEGYARIPLSSEQDHAIGELLAMIRSQNQAIEQALAYLRTQPFLSASKLALDYQPALALILSEDDLFYAPKANASHAPEAAFRVKLNYDSLNLPDSAEVYLQKNFYQITMVKRYLERNLELEQAAIDYLNRLAVSEDPAYLSLLRNSEGKRLQQLERMYLLWSQVDEYFAREQYSKALKTVDEALLLDPSNADLLMSRALIQRELKQYDKSIKDLTQAIAQAPDEAVFYLMRGSMHLERGLLFDQGLKDLSRSLELNPNIAMSYKLRGMIYEKLKNCPAALADFKRACELGTTSLCNKTCSGF